MSPMLLSVSTQMFWGWKKHGVGLTGSPHFQTGNFTFQVSRHVLFIVLLEHQHLWLDSICVSPFFAIKNKYANKKLSFSKPASSEIAWTPSTNGHYHLKNTTAKSIVNESESFLSHLDIRRKFIGLREPPDVHYGRENTVLTRGCWYLNTELNLCCCKSRGNHRSDDRNAAFPCLRGGYWEDGARLQALQWEDEKQWA